MKKSSPPRRNDYRLEKLEKRILLAADIPAEVLQDATDAQAGEPTAGDVIALAEQEVTSTSENIEYEPTLSEPLIDLGEAEAGDPTAITDPESTDVADDQSQVTIHLTPETDLQLDSPLLIDGNEVLNGSGTIDGSVINEALVSPGNSPGMQNIEGDFTQTSDGTTLIELGGTTAGTGYDQINVLGTANLAGTLDVDLYNGFTPSAGDRFEIFTWDSSNGSFETYTGLDLGSGKWLDPVYSESGLELVVSELLGGLQTDLLDAAVTDDLLNFIAGELDGASFSLSGDLALGGQNLSGDLTFSWSGGQLGLSASNLAFSSGLGDLSFNITEGSGNFLLTDSGVAGSISGQTSVSGIPDVSLSGSGSISFNSTGSAVNTSVGGELLSFTANQNSRISGSLTAAVNGLADLSGDFVVEWDPDAVQPLVLVDGRNITATVTDSSRTGQLSGGSLAMVVTTDTNGDLGYALTATGSVALSGLNESIPTFSCNVTLLANQLGESVDQSFNIAGSERSVSFASGDAVLSTEFDLGFSSELSGYLDTMAREIIQLQDDLTVGVDDDGNLVYNSVLSQIIPGTDTSLEGLLGFGDIFEVGSYIRHYLQPQLGALSADEIEHSLGDYSATGNAPSMQGLIDYLNTNWLPTLGGGLDGLDFAVTADGLAINFANALSISETITIDVGDSVRDFGLNLDAPITVDVTAICNAALSFTISRDLSDANFSLDNSTFSVTGNVNDLVLAAGFGPLEVSLGSADGDKATISLEFTGSLSLDSSGNVSYATTSDSVTVTLPIYADLAGVDLSALSGLPTIVITANPLTSSDGFSYTTSNFDSLTSFPALSVSDLILMFPTLVDTLDAIKDSDNLLVNLPFVDTTLQSVSDFANAFEAEVYDQIDFNRARVDLLSGTGSLSAGTRQLELTGITADMAGKFITFTGIGTLQITSVDVDSGLADLAGSFAEDITDTAWTVHEKVEQIQTLQEFITAINDSGILPTGMQISYDAVNQKFVVPVSFAMTPAAISSTIDLGIDLGDAASLSTEASSSVSTDISGGLSLFFDLDGLDGLSDLLIGLEDLWLQSDIELAANDLEVALTLGFLGLTAGGAGSGSTLRGTAQAGVTLEKAGGSTSFSLEELLAGDYTDALQFSLSGSGSAVLKDLSVNPGFGSDVALPGNPEIALYVQDIFSVDNVVQVDHDPLGAAFDLAGFVADGGAAATDTVVVLPDLGDAFNFKELSFLDIIGAVRQGIDFIENSVGQEDFYTAVLPILNVSLADTLTFFDDFAAKLEEAAADPAGTIQEVEAIIEDALGLNDNNALPANDQLFSLSYADDVLTVHMNYSAVFSTLITFNLDMDEVNRLAGGALAGLDNIPLLSDSLGAGAAANIELAAMFDLQVDAGIDLSDIANPELFLFDYDQADDSGTYATLGFRVAGSELEMGFNIGPLAMGVEQGVAVIDGDGDITTTDFATITIALGQLDEAALAQKFGASAAAAIVALLPPDDGRFRFDEDIRYNILPIISGDITVDLPLRVDFNGLEFDIPSLTLDLLPTISFDDLLSGLNMPDVGTLFDISLPDFDSIFADIGFSFTLDLMLQQPWQILDGFDIALGNLEDLFMDLIDLDLPFIGDILPDFAGFLADIRLGVLGDLRLALSVNGDAISVLRDTYYAVFGASGLNILQDATGDGQITIDDVLTGWYSREGELLADWQYGDATLAGADSIQFDMELGSTILGTGFDIPLDIDLPGFSFDIDGGFGLAMDWSLDFGTGISGSDGFYLVTGPADDPEFEVDISIFLDGDTSTRAVDTFSADGTLAFFTAHLTDNGTADHAASGLYGDIDIDFIGNEYNRLTLLTLLARPASQNFVSDFRLDGALNLDMVLEVEGVSVLPKLVGDLVVDWDYSLSGGTTTPSITIENLGVDVGSLVNDFMLPIIEKIEDVLSPIEPVIDALYQDVGMDIIGIDNVMDLIDTIMLLQGKPAINWAFVHAVNAMLDMADTVRSWAAMDGVILLGDLTNLGTDNAGTSGDDSVVLPSNFSANYDDVSDDASASAGTSSVARSGFRMLEYVTDISNWFNILTGGDAILFTYEMPLLQASARFDVPIFGLKLGPAKFGIIASGAVSLTADFAFGYDTYGIRKSIETGDAIYALDGFYVSDVTMPTFKNGSIVAGTGGEEKPELLFDLTVALDAGVDAGIIKAGLTGGITFYANFDLQDIARSVLTKDADGDVTSVRYESDGKIRMSEIVTMYEYQGGGFTNLFNIEGGADVFAKAYVKVSLPFVGTQTVVDKTLFKMEIFSFSYDAPYVEPTLAHMSGSTLTVNAGATAGDREYFDVEDGGEQFWLYGSGGTVSIEFDGWYQTFTGVSQVVIDLGDGDDMLDATRLSDVSVTGFGGDGDDTLMLGDTGILHGGAGNDTLIAADFIAELYGDAGDDTYYFTDGYGRDRFADTSGTSYLDFSAAVSTLSFVVGRSGVSVASSSYEDEVRTGLAKVQGIILGAGNDTVWVNSFADYPITITDGGGNDDYHIRLDRPDADLPQGVLNIVDNSGSFDELTVMQTIVQTPISLNNGQVVNGREVINYNSGMERLTVVGKEASYTAASIQAFGGDLNLTTDAVSGIADLGEISLRLIGDEISYDMAIRAANIIVDALADFTVTNQLTAIQNGYIDLRTYGDDSDLILEDNLVVSAGTADAGDSTDGWLRLTSADGSIINASGAFILAAGSTLQLRAFSAIGTSDAGMRTKVARLTAITSAASAGDIVIEESDDLIIETQATLTDVENSGFVVTPGHGPDWWEDKVAWDNAASSDWLQVIQAGRTNYGVEIGNGDLELTLLAQNALLTLESGDIHGLATAAGGSSDADLTITADDVDFVSGENRITASGDLTIQANQLVWDYLLGSAGEDYGGPEIVRNLHSGSMAMGMRDFAALSDGFTSITIGRRDHGNTMTVGDIFNATEVKMTQVPRSDNAELTDQTVLLSDDLQVKGQVVAADNSIELQGRTISINSQNIHDPLGLPDSGISADTIVIAADDQLHVGGSLIADSLVDIDVTATGSVNPTGTTMYVTPPNGATSLFMDVGSSIETLDDAGMVVIDTSAAVQIGSFIEVHGIGSTIDINAGGDFLLNEAASIVGRDADALLDITAGGLLAINAGAAVSAGIRYDMVGDTPVPVLTGAGADIRLSSTNEMLLAGSLGSADGLEISSGTASRDNELFGDPDEASYLSQYTIYNKTAYFDMLAALVPDHYLADHTGQYGLMVTGTIVSLGADTDLLLTSNDDLILRGNVSALGSGSTIAFQSDVWTYLEGNVLADSGISVAGGMELNGTDLAGADQHGTSVYVHATSTIRTTAADADIDISGSADVELHGAVVAGGTIGANGVIWSGAGADLSVSAGSQMLVDTGLLAAGNVTISGGTADAGDNDLSLLITSAGGATARGYGATGGDLTITADGDMETMGYLLAGGSLFQTFDTDGNLLTQTVDWSGTPGTTSITTTGQAFIGGNTVNSLGQPTVTGGYIYSASDITISGGTSADGTGAWIQGGSELVVHQADGHIDVSGVGDALIEGLLVAGGEVVQIRDAGGTYQGRQVNTFGGASSITVSADNQIIVGVGLQAGSSIELIGGEDPSGTGIILYGSAMLSTWMENSVIDLNAPGRIDILAPGHTNQLLSQGWPENADGVLSSDVTLDIVIDKVNHTISSSVTLAAADTADNDSVDDLVEDLQAALEAADWLVADANASSPYNNGEFYTHFADDPDTTGQVDPDLKIKLSEGKLNFTGPYSFTIADSSTNSDLLGLDLSAGTLESGTYYAIDAREAGSVVNIGSADSPVEDCGKLYIAGKVIANSAINLYSGTSPDLKDIEVAVTGVLETVNGSIAFDAGEHGLVSGDIIAGGVGSDVVLSSSSSLTIEGNIDAYHDVILAGGQLEEADALSLKIKNTAAIISSGGGGSITLGGANEVIIDGVVGTGSTSLAELAITSTYGTVTVTNSSGWITADAPLTISGVNVDIDGVVESSAADIDGDEVVFSASKTLTVRGDVSVSGDLRMEATGATGLVEIYDAAVAVTGADATLSVVSAGDISSSSTGVAADHAVLDDGQLYQLGGTIQGTGLVRFSAAGDVRIGAAMLIGTSAAGSQILLSGATGTVIGSVLAGAEIRSGTAVWSAGNATLSATFSEQLILGGDAFVIDGTTTSFEAAGGRLQSSGDMTITVTGGTTGLAMSQNSLSTIVVDSSAGNTLSAAATPSTLLIQSDRAVNLYGFIQTLDEDAILTINSGALLIDGIIEAGSLLDIDATSLVVNAMVYQRGGTGNLYFIDENGKLMDGLGYLVDSDGNYVDANGDALSEGTDPVEGGQPVRISGGILDSDPGGTIDISTSGDIYLNGQIAKPVISGSTITTNVDMLTVHSSGGDISVSGLVHANDSVTLSAQDITVASGGVVRTRGEAGSVRLAAAGNMLISADYGAGEGSVTAADLVHLSAGNMQIDGLVNVDGDSDARLLLNVSTALYITGTLTSSGSADLRGGISLASSEEELTSATVDAAELNAVLIKVSSDGGVYAAGDVHVVTGGDLTVYSLPELQDGTLALLTPIISTETITVQVVTGYQQVADGFILVPKVTWVTTTVTEQTGTEEIKAGISYHTMDITLTQDGYYNGTTYREWFVEGVDYHNSAVTWSLTGATSPGSGYVPFSSLNDLQKAAVLKHLGYMPLYNFSYSNTVTHTVLNGNPSEQTWNPDWAGNGNTIVNIQVAGWEDKYIRLPSGAAADVLRVVSQGEATVWNETVGTYWDEAKVLYTQDKSDHTASSSTYYKETDLDSSNDRWSVDYYSNGIREYSIYDGRTGSSTVSHSFTPLWDGSSHETDYDLLSRYITAPSGYDDTTSALSYVSLYNTHSVIVGYAYDKLYDVTVIVDEVYLNINTESGEDEEVVEARVSGGGYSGAYHSGQRFLAAEDGALFDINYVVYRGYDLAHDTELFWVMDVYEDDDGNWDWSSGDDQVLYETGWVSIPLDTSFTISKNDTRNGEYARLNLDFSSTSSWVLKNPISETFKDYIYYWTSNSNTITDTRKTLHYQYTSTTTDIYETRPVYNSYDVETKVVQEQQYTVWRNEPIYEDQTITSSTRSYDSNDVNFGAFENDALSAGGNLLIETGGNTSISGLLSVTGSQSTLSIDAAGTLSINGLVPDSAPAGTVAATAKLTSSGSVDLRSGSTLTIGNAGEISAGTTLLLSSASDLSAQGKLSGSETIDLSASTDIQLGGEFTTATDITITAGTSGTGSITGNVGALLTTTGDAHTISLTAGSSDGDITLTGSSIAGNTGSVNLTADSGAILHSSGMVQADALTALSRDGFAVRSELGEIDVLNSGSGGIAISNHTNQARYSALSVSRADTGSGTVSLFNDATVQATLLRTGGLSDADDISVEIYNGGLSYTTIGVAEGGLGDVSLKLQGGLVSSGGATLIRADALTLDLPGAIDITTEINSLTARSYESGDVTIVDQSADGLDINQLTVAEGLLSLTATGSIGIQEALLLSNTATATIVSGGAVSGIANSGNRNLAAHSLSLNAVSGVTNLHTQLNEISGLVSTGGDISITNSEVSSDGISGLLLRSITAADGSVSLTSDGAVTVWEAQAQGAAASLSLSATGGDLVVRDPGEVGGSGIFATSSIALSSSDKLDLEVRVDAEDSLSLTSGRDLVLDTGTTYAADELTIVSAESISMTGDLSFGGGLSTGGGDVSMTAGRNILLNGRLIAADGSVDSLSLTALGNNPLESLNLSRDPEHGLTIFYDADNERVLLDDVNDNNQIDAGEALYRGELNGMFVQEGVYTPDNSSLDPQRIIYLSEFKDGSGTLTNVDGSVFSYAADRFERTGRSVVLDETVDSTTLTHLLDRDAAIEFDLGTTVFGAITVVADGYHGTIDLTAAQDIDLSGSSLQATGTINLNTSGSLLVTENSISGVNSDNPESITLSSGGNMTINSALTVEDTTTGSADAEQVLWDIPVSSAITLTSGGTLNVEGVGHTLTTTTLTASAATGMRLQSDAAYIDASLSASGNVTINDIGAVEIDRIDIGGSGMVSVSAGGQLDINAIIINVDAENNAVNASATGDLSVDLINAGRNNGVVLLSAEGSIVELNSDADVDIVAKTLTALTDDVPSFDLELDVGTSNVGKPDDLELTWDGDFSLSGDFAGHVTINVTGALTIDGLSAGTTIDATAGTGLTVGGAGIAAGGTVSLSGVGITINGPAVISGTTLTISGTSGTVTMEEGSSLSGDTISLTSDSDLRLAALTASGTATLTAGGAILDNTVAESANITAGQINLQAGTTIGRSDSPADDLDIRGAISATAGGDLVLEDSVGANILSLLSSTGDILLGGGTATIIDGDITALAGAFTLLTGSLSYGTGGTTTAAQSVQMRTTSGNISLATNTSVQADVGDLSLDSAGSLDTAGGTSLTSSAGNLNLTAATTMSFADTGTLSADGNIVMLADGTIRLAELSADSVSVTSTNGTILDNTAAETANITATGSISLSASGDIGAADAGDLDLDGTTSANSVSGDVYLGSPSSLILDTVTAGGTGWFNATDAIEVGSEVTTGGTLSFTSGSFSLADGGAISAPRVAITTTTQGIALGDTSTVDATVGDLGLLAVGDISLSTLNATGTATITSSAGAIFDASSAEERNITAGTQTILQAATGIGQGPQTEAEEASNPRDIDVAGQISATTTSGDIYLASEEGIVLDSITNNGTGAVGIYSGGSVVLSQSISMDGSLSLTAGDDFTLTGNAVLSAANLHVGAGSGILTMDTGTSMTATGELSLRAGSDILLTTVNADSVRLNAGGAIIDSTVAEDANITATTMELTADSGIGGAAADQDLDIEGAATATTRIGGIFLSDANDMVINGATITEDGPALLTAAGSLTVLGDIDAAGVVQLSGQSLQVGTASISGSETTLNATAGAISSTGTNSVGSSESTVTITATDKIELHNVQAATNATVDGLSVSLQGSASTGGLLQIDSLGATLLGNGGQTGSMLVTSAGSLNMAGSFSVGSSLTTTSTSLQQSGSIQVGSVATMTTSAGDLLLDGSLSSGSNATLTSAGALAMSGGLSSGGQALLTGQSVSFGNTVTASGAMDITAGGGSISGSTNSLLQSSGAAVTAQAAGDMSLGSVRAASSATMTGNSITISGEVITGGLVQLNSGGSSAMNGGGVIGNGLTIQAGGSVELGGDMFVLGQLSASGSSFSQSGSLLVSGPATLNAGGGSMDLGGQVSGNSYINLSAAGSVNIGSLSSNDSVVVQSGGNISDSGSGITSPLTLLYAGGDIGSAGNFFDISTNYVGALAGGNIYLHFPTAPQVVSPGIWSQGNGNVELTIDVGRISHGGIMQGAGDVLGGNFIGTAGSGYVKILQEALPEKTTITAQEQQTGLQTVSLIDQILESPSLLSMLDEVLPPLDAEQLLDQIFETPAATGGANRRNGVDQSGAAGSSIIKRLSEWENAHARELLQFDASVRADSFDIDPRFDSDQPLSELINTDNPLLGSRPGLSMLGDFGQTAFYETDDMDDTEESLMIG